MQIDYTDLGTIGKMYMKATNTYQELHNNQQLKLNRMRLLLLPQLSTIIDLVDLFL
nr:MAG TPA: hypothetical protein [Caudoviricetes sp.]